MKFIRNKKKLVSKQFLLLFLFVFICLNSLFSQEKNYFFQKSDTLNKERKKTVLLIETVGAGLSLLALNQLWYADYPRSNFHFHNDNKEWLQMDKFGHTFSSYYIGKMGMDALDWAGASKKEQLLYGATLGFVFLTTVEIFDGFSEEWGFSTGDVIANGLGTGLLIGQEVLWDEQRIQLKFSFHTTSFAESYPDKLGENTLQQILKDYNGQTYWLSINLWSFFKESRIPKWLNVAIGYGANGVPKDMFQNEIYPGKENQTYRQFYTSLDIDLTKIKTKSTFLKTAFNVFNFIKIPAPTLEFSKENKFKFHYLYF